MSDDPTPPGGLVTKTAMVTGGIFTGLGALTVLLSTRAREESILKAYGIPIAALYVAAGLTSFIAGRYAGKMRDVKHREKLLLETLSAKESHTQHQR